MPRRLGTIRQLGRFGQVGGGRSGNNCYRVSNSTYGVSRHHLGSTRLLKARPPFSPPPPPPPPPTLQLYIPLTRPLLPPQPLLPLSFGVRTVAGASGCRFEGTVHREAAAAGSARRRRPPSGGDRRDVRPETQGGPRPSGRPPAPQHRLAAEPEARRGLRQRTSVRLHPRAFFGRVLACPVCASWGVARRACGCACFVCLVLFVRDVRDLSRRGRAYSKSKRPGRIVRACDHTGWLKGVSVKFSERSERKIDNGRIATKQALF